MLWPFRRGGARTQGGIKTLMLETVGGHSGEPRRSVLGYLAENDEAWLVIAGLAGAARHPGWFHNLAAQPDATVELDDDRRVDVRAATLQGADLAAAWQRIGRGAPEFVGYRSKTDREIPVVRLRRRTAMLSSSQGG